MAEERNPYKMNLLTANKTKLYNQGVFWAFNTAKYRALLSNDPSVIKYWYKYEAGTFFPDVYKFVELARSFYYGDEFVENAEEFFGIIPMICESIAKLVCGSGYTFDENLLPEILTRLKTILDDNEFDNEILKASIIETLGLGSPAWHIHFDPEISDSPIIELIPPERLELKKKSGRITEYIIKQQVIIDNEPQPYELHTCYTKRRKKVSVNGAVRYKDDGIEQWHRIWEGTKYLDRDTSLKQKIFTAYGIEERSVLPLVDFPVIYLPNNLNNTQGAATLGQARPYGIVFGLDGVSAALDEILSNCTDTVRKAFPFLMIDQQMIPSNVQGDKELGAFSTRRHSFVIPKSAVDPEKLLQMVQAQLNTTEYVDAAKFQINIALNKVGINAATLGLQLTGHVEAEATQNAKERNSIRTRNTLASDYERYLSKLFAVLLQYDDYIGGNIIAIDDDTGEEGIVADEYHCIAAHFGKYIVDTPEEVSDVLAKKVQSRLMSVFAAQREQHPDWAEQDVYKEANIIYAENGLQIQVADPSKPTKDSTVLNADDFNNDEDNKLESKSGEGKKI